MATHHAPSRAPASRRPIVPLVLGLLSIGLGAAQLAAPRWFGRAIGATGRRHRPGMVRLIGAREIAAGAGLLAARPAPFLWMRVLGDAMDLVLLRRAASARGTRRDRIDAATVGVLGIGATDLLSALGAVAGEGGALAARPVRRSITIARPVSDVFAFWRRLEQLPLFMRHIDSVTELDARRSRWVATGPGGMRFGWDAEIIGEERDRSISWRTMRGSRVRHDGVVRFLPAPGGRGTEVHVDLTYRPPAGPLGVVVAKLTGREPGQQVAEDLRRLKQLLETGGIVRSEATAGGRRIRQRPAQPIAEPPPPAVSAPGAGRSAPEPRTSRDGDTSRAADAGAGTDATSRRWTPTSEAAEGKQQPIRDGSPVATAGGTR